MTTTTAVDSIPHMAIATAVGTVRRSIDAEWGPIPFSIRGDASERAAYWEEVATRDSIARDMIRDAAADMAR